MREFAYTPADLKCSIERLPRRTNADSRSVLQNWVMGLPLRYQGVLVTALRGCDGAGKEDRSKALTAMVRRAVLNPADERETESKRGFFGFDPARLLDDAVAFFHSMDGYPFHYIMHLLHACEVIAYHHPAECFREFFWIVYATMVHSMHLEPESREDMGKRLTEDRVAKGTVDRDFVNGPVRPSDYDPAMSALDYVTPAVG